MKEKFNGLFVRTICSRLVLLILSFYVVLHIYTFFTENGGYLWWTTSDWLINYENGFVRRGLIGEILLKCYKVHPYDVRIAIRIIYFLSSVCIVLLVYRTLRRLGMSMLFTLTGCCFAYTLFTMFGRRDFIIFILAFFIVKNYADYENNRNLQSLLVFESLSILIVLVHEASFFLCFPLLMIYDFCKRRKSVDSLMLKLAKECLLFSPVIIAMLMSVIYKGNAHYADVIWSSWSNVFNQYPSGENLSKPGLGVAALGWSAKGTFLTTLGWTFMGETGNQSVFRIPFALFLYFSTFYLIIHCNDADPRLYPVKAIDKSGLSSITFMQFIIMLPFFSLLSCDTGRNLAYWVISSIFIYYYLPNFSKTIGDKYVKLTSCLAKNLPVSANWHCFIYLFLLLVTPFSIVMAPGLNNTIQGRLIEEIINLI